MKLKAAVVGLGAIGQNHARIYAGMEGVRLAAIVDTDEAALTRASSLYRAEAYRDCVAMLDKEHPDVVSVAVPTSEHCAVACAAIERGANVLVEKPIAFTEAEGRQIIEQASRRNVKLTVGYVERFNPAIIEARKRLQGSELGRVFQFHARRLSPFPARIQDVGVVLDLATHDIDVMMYLSGSSVTRVYAEIAQQAHKKCEDLLSGLMRFADGTVGALDVNWLTPTKVRQLGVLGEGGMYLIDYLTQDFYWYKNAKMDRMLDAFEVFLGVWEGDMLKVQVPKREPLRAELESFVSAVAADRAPVVSGEDALEVLDLAHRLIESGRTHAPVVL